MSEENTSANVIIPVEHQSAPKEHWMVKELQKAAEELDKGTFAPELDDDEYFYIGPEQLLAKHPRILEALERLKTEVSTAKNSQEYIEKSQMLHEINENLQTPDKWDGQGRWIGKDNEQMRHGELLDPITFWKRLTAVIGESRVFLCSFAVMGRVALLVEDPAQEQARLCALPPAIDYNRRIREAEQHAGKDFKQVMKKLEASFSAAESARYSPPEELEDRAQVATLQWPVGTEWMVMRFNDYGVPTSAKYLGWRTALLSMILLDVITEAEAHKAFPVKQNAASLWYRAQLYHFRNGGKADA
jgi:hypothetical protein